VNLSNISNTTARDVALPLLSTKAVVAGLSLGLSMARHAAHPTSDPSRGPLRVVIALATLATGVIAAFALLLVGTPCDSGGDGGCKSGLNLVVLAWAVSGLVFVRVGHWYWRTRRYREAARYAYMGVGVSLAWCVLGFVL
jgi:hypothetical protein